MRLIILKRVIFILFFILLADLFWMQVINGPVYVKQSESNRVRLVPEEASRGIIYDRNQIPLVENKLAFDVVAVPQEIESKNKNAIFHNLSKFLEVSPDVLADTFAYNYDASFSPVMIASDVPRKTAFLIEQEMAQLSGVFIKTRSIRHYPYSKAAAHLIGYVGKMMEDDYPELKKYGYRTKDVIGRSGMERYFDASLRGKPGGMQLEVNNEGSIIKVLSYRPPVRGNDIYSTIDINLQTLIGELVNDSRGAITVMDAETGEIFASYSGPSYDPNFFISGKDELEIEKILSNKDSPLLNRNLNIYPPGSIFKIVTSYAGLSGHFISRGSTVYCSGSYNIGNSQRFCWQKEGHGSVNLIKALATSCNVFFWDLGNKIGERNIAFYAKEFGLGKLTGIELPGERVGVVPNALWKSVELRQKWYGGDTINFAIGQGYLLISPIQALKMAAFVANGGKEVTPHLVKNPSLETKNNRILSLDIIRVIQEGMLDVVGSSYGTGRKAFISGINVWAKTGTAQVAGQSPHAWFVGFTQVKNRKICFVLFFENGGHGGERAAEIARQIVLYFNKG